MLPTLAALSLGDDDCGDCTSDLSTDVPTDVNKTPTLSEIVKELNRRRKANNAVDRVIAKQKSAEEAAAEKVARQMQREQAKEDKAEEKLLEFYLAEERELKAKAVRAADDAAKTLTIHPVEAWVDIEREYTKVFGQFVEVLDKVDGASKDPNLLLDDTIAKLERERTAAVRRIAAAQREVQEIEKKAKDYKEARVAGTRARMSEAEKEAMKDRRQQLKRLITTQGHAVTYNDEKLSVGKLLWTLAIANAWPMPVTARSLFEAQYPAETSPEVLEQAWDRLTPDAFEALTRRAADQNKRNVPKLSAASVDAVWDVALRAFAPEAAARAKHLYDRRTIDMVASSYAPGGVRISMDPRWTGLSFLREEISKLFNKDNTRGLIRYLSGKEAGDPVRILINDKSPNGGATVLRGLAFEIAVAKVDIALANYRVDFDRGAPAASSSTDVPREPVDPV
jgi:hypothetical protein